MSDLTLPPPPRRPWQRQHDESEADHLRFLRWLFSDSRAAELPGNLHRLALQHRWQHRAMLVDKRLSSAPQTVEQVASNIAADALTILTCELEFKAARAMQSPGDVPLKDLNGLLRLLAELGAFAGKAQTSAEDVDIGELTDHEAQVLAEAAAILTRRRKP